MELGVAFSEECFETGWPCMCVSVITREESGVVFVLISQLNHIKVLAVVSARAEWNRLGQMGAEVITQGPVGNH